MSVADLPEVRWLTTGRPRTNAHAFTTRKASVCGIVRVAREGEWRVWQPADPPKCGRCEKYLVIREKDAQRAREGT